MLSCSHWGLHLLPPPEPKGWVPGQCAPSQVNDYVRALMGSEMDFIADGIVAIPKIVGYIRVSE